MKRLFRCACNVAVGSLLLPSAPMLAQEPQTYQGLEISVLKLEWVDEWKLGEGPAAMTIRPKEGHRYAVLHLQVTWSESNKALKVDKADLAQVIQQRASPEGAPPSALYDRLDRAFGRTMALVA